MKLTVFLLTAAFLNVSGKTVSQTVSFSGQAVSLKSVFTEVKKQTGYSVLYSTASLDQSKPVTLHAHALPLLEFLDILFNDQPFQYSIESRTIIVTPSPLPVVPPGRPGHLSYPVVSSDQPVFLPIAGTVRSSDGTPLAGASVRVKGKKITTVTDDHGRFSLTANEGDVLIISFVGYANREHTISGASAISITLELSVKEEDAVEVYSTGYQEIPRERSTGSFVLLDNKMINRTVSTNILDRIINVTGSLKSEKGIGSNSDISIRGYSTINANMKPLIVVDGFPYDESFDVPSLFSISTLLNNINPNDIESITVLRDAAAASIWGARSGNGVIVITTKKGNYNRKTTVQLTSSVNFIAKPDLKYLPIISSKDAVEFEKAQFLTGKFNDYDDIYPGFDYFPVLSPVTEILLAERRGAITEAEAEARLALLSDHDVRDDISRYLLRTGVNQQYNLNVSGGSSRNSYYGSIGYDHNASGGRGDDNSRLSLRFDNTFRPIDKVEINTYINYVQGLSRSNSIGYTSYLANGRSIAAPYTRLADENGNPLHVPFINQLREAYIDTISLPGLLDWHYRPLDEMKYSNNSSKEYSTRFGGALKYHVTSWLNMEFRGQYEKRLINGKNEYDMNSYSTRDLINSYMYIDPAGKNVYPIPLGSILNLRNTDATNWNIRGQLNVNKNWQNHQINALAGYEASEKEVISDQFSRYGYDPETGTSKPDIDYVTNFALRPSGNGSRKIPSPSYSWGGVNRFRSYFGNAGYTYKGKYTMTAGGRIDESNFLGAKHNQRYVPLYSTGLSWNISDEGFYKVDGLPYLRLRMTYGYNGNLNNLATALPTSRINPPSGTYHAQPTSYLVSPPNPGLTWEKIRMINIGVDFRAFKNRIDGSIEYYTKKGVNLIGSIVADPTSGVSDYIGNYASMKGNGVDILMNTTNINGDVTWKSNFCFSYNADKVTNYTLQGSGPDLVYSYASSPNLPIPGKPLQKLYSYSFAGLDPESGNPMGYVKRKGVDFSEALLSAQVEDLTYHGSAAPRIFGSLINTISYREISLTFNITYRFLYFFRRSSIDYAQLAEKWGGHSDYALRWQKPGDEVYTAVPSLPEFFDQTRDDFYNRSSVLVERGDHIRFEDISLGYNLLKSRIKWIPFNRASIYLNANHLGIIWRKNKHDLDPSVPSGSIPQQRNIAARLTIDF